MKKLIIMLALAVVLSPIASMAENIGFIDIERIFSNYPEAKKIQEEVQKTRETYQKEFLKKQEKIEKAKSKGTSEDKIKKMIDEMEEELRPKQEAIIRQEAEIQRRLLSKIVETSKAVAKTYEIQVVLAKQVVFVGGFDLTEFVIDKLNK